MVLAGLGNGTTEDSNVPICISDIEGNALNGKNITNVYDGNTYGTNMIIAKDIDGKIYTWGYKVHGQLGDGEEAGFSVSTEPKCISDIEGNALNGKKITGVYCGYNGSIITRDINGKIYTWGYNNYGQLGNGTTEDSNVPICISDIEGNVLNGKNITDIYVGGDTTIAKDVDGKIYTWGDNYYGQFGNGTKWDKSSEPICISDIEGNVLNGKNITDIYCSGSSTIAKDIDGKIYTWGSNSSGQLGDGTTEDRSEPICISDIEGNALNGKNISDIYFDGYTIAKDVDGKIYTWGANWYGELGNGTTEDSTVPICINDIEGSELEDKTIKKFFADFRYIYYVTEGGTFIHTWQPAGPS